MHLAEGAGQLMATTRLDDSTRYAVPATAQRRDPRERRDQEPREALVEAVLERVGDAVVVTDAGGRTVLANEASRRLLTVGTRPVTADGEARTAAYAPAELPVRRALRGEEVVGAEVMVPGESPGERRWYRIDASPVRDARDGIIGAVAIGRDVTADKALALALSRERATVDLLLAIAREANHATVPAHGLRAAVEHVCRYAGWPVGHLLLVNDGKLVPTGLWYCDDSVQYGVFRAATEAMTFTAQTSLVGRVLETASPQWASDLPNHPVFSRRSAALYCGLQTAFVAPIIAGDEVVAAIEMYTPEAVDAVDELTRVVPEAVSLLGRVVERDRARQERERHVAELEQRALNDEATGLYNRRGFFAVADQQLAVARRKRRSALLFSLDLDGLKEVNERVGHDAGDRLIGTAARVLRATFREIDVMARLGGDEFVVLAPEAGIEDVESILHRLHDEAHRLSKGQPSAVEWSVGIAAYEPSRPEPLEDLIKRADQLMTENKRRRRKRRSSRGEAKDSNG
jgi:diguanylate cyclase (GGDEF)-like protein/PAS domain S-box-containing protein